MSTFFTDSEISLFDPEQTRAKIISFEERLRETHSEICLFGAGQFSRDLLMLHNEYNYPIHFDRILDNNPNLDGKCLDGLPIVPPARPADEGKTPFVIICLSRWADANGAVADCKRFGYSYVLASDFIKKYTDPMMISQRIAYFERETGEFAKPESWADDLSFQTYRSLVRLRVLGYPPIIDEGGHDEYFDPCVPKKYYRSFVDVGSFRGDTFLNFYRRFGNDYDSYYALEATAPIYELAHRLLADFPRTRCENLAAWRTREKLRFSNNLISGNFVMEDRAGIGTNLNNALNALVKDYTEVQADTLDNILADQTVTFIKMDIEGSEIDALEGAKSIIHSQKPALGICIYHSDEQFCQIPQWMKAQDVGYELYCRHYHHTVAETTCYAVPRR